MRVGLGTVQFGCDYGISNRDGKTPLAEVRRILSRAYGAGIRVLDTAAMYGDSETVLGEVIDRRQRFRIVTKTVPVEAPEVGAQQAADFRAGFLRSLERLNRDSVYGLLVHQVDDLLKPGGERLVDLLLEFREAGLVSEIGISIYSAAQIDRVSSLFTPDIIQLPMNVLDQRLIQSGHIATLKKQGVEIHARSLFLQGLLLQSPSETDAYFAPIRRHLDEYHAFLIQHGMTPLQGALKFAADTAVDCLLAGVCRAEQLDEILGAMGSLPAETVDMSAFALADVQFLNPAQWRLH